MAQHDYVIANGTGAAVRSDLNNALAAIVSQNSGATEPATTYAFQFWADTTTGTLKLRNSANSAWIELLQLDGTLTMEDGTEALPGLSFRNDLDTGLWRPGTNQLAISTNAVERVEFGASEVVFNDGGANYDFRVEGDTNANLLFVDASADAVGIGTSSPSSLLHLSVATAASDGTKGVRITNPAGTAAMFECGSSNDSYVGTTSGSDFSIRTNNTSRIYVTNGGNVGIGTTSPAATTHISSSSAEVLRLQHASTPYQSFYLGSNRGAYILSNTSYLEIAAESTSNNTIMFSTSGAEKARLDSSGRLLVGTSTARANYFNSTLSAALQIEGTGHDTSSVTITRNSNDGSAPTISLAKSRGTTTGSNTVVQNGDDLGYLAFQGSDGSEFVGGAYIYATVDGTPGANDLPTRLVFSVTQDGSASPTERVRIENNGRRLHFSSNDGCIQAVSGAAGTTTYVFVGRHSSTSTTSGTDSFYVFSNGNVQNTNNSYTAISDIKLKENVVDARSQWDDIKALQVRNYNLKEGQTHKQIGLIAQEVEPISPGLIYESPDRDAEGNDLGTTTKSVQYSVLYMKAVKALQEAMERIEQLEVEMAEVKAQLS